MTAGGPLPLRAVFRLGLGLAEALQAIHAAGVVHRDLKPSNVLLAADGPRVIDFGIARAAEHSSLTRTGTIVGSAGFMAPEQITGGETGPAADVFALGAVLTFAASGQGPFGEGRTEALVYRVVYADPTLDGVPYPVREIVSRCLAKDPRYRPAPGGVIAALAAIPATGPGAGEGWLPEPAERLIGLRQVAGTAAGTASPAPVPTVSPEPMPMPPAPMDDSAIPTRTSLGTGQAGTTPQVPSAPYYAPVPSGPPGPARPQPGAARRVPGWLLAAVAFGVVLVVAVVVAVTRLSAAHPGPSAGLAAGSSTVASHPVSPTSSGPASSGPASSAAPSPSATPSGPAAVVQAYYAAINNHDCGAAWNLGGDNLSAAQGQTYQQFCQGFSTTSRDILTVDSVAGNTVTVTIVAQHTDGSSQTYRGSYLVGNGVIQSASVQASS